MEVPFNSIFEVQQQKYGFCFTCEDCVHYDGESEECTLEFPNYMHRIERYCADPRPTDIIFCKEFDLS